MILDKNADPALQLRLIYSTLCLVLRPLKKNFNETSIFQVRFLPVVLSVAGGPGGGCAGLPHALHELDCTWWAGFSRLLVCIKNTGKIFYSSHAIALPRAGFYGVFVLL
jgi:hypothetical protein